MNYSRRVTHHNAVRRHVLGYDRACTDDGVLANTHPTKDYRASAKPHVIPYRDRLSRLPLRPTQLCVGRMRRRQELDVRPDLNVVADHNPGDVEGHQAEVGERTDPDVNLVDIIAVQRWPDLRSFAQIS